MGQGNRVTYTGLVKGESHTFSWDHRKGWVGGALWRRRSGEHSRKREQNAQRLKAGSVHFSRSVVSDSLWPHGLQHARLPCPSPTPGVYPDSCPLSRWCHPTISSSVVPFSSCLQSFPASRSFPMSQLFALGGQSIGVLTSTSVLSMNTQDWSPSEWTGWISLQSKGLSRVFSNTVVQNFQELKEDSAIRMWGVFGAFACLLHGESYRQEKGIWFDFVCSRKQLEILRRQWLKLVYV